MGSNFLVNSWVFRFLALDMLFMFRYVSLRAFVPGIKYLIVESNGMSLFLTNLRQMQIAAGKMSSFTSFVV